MANIGGIVSGIVRSGRRESGRRASTAPREESEHAFGLWTCQCIKCRAARAQMRPRRSKKDSLERAAAEMRQKYLTSGSGCKSRMRAILARTGERGIAEAIYPKQESL